MGTVLQPGALREGELLPAWQNERIVMAMPGRSYRNTPPVSLTAASAQLAMKRSSPVCDVTRIIQGKTHARGGRYNYRQPTAVLPTVAT